MPATVVDMIGLIYGEQATGKETEHEVKRRHSYRQREGTSYYSPHTIQSFLKCVRQQQAQ
jgi:hypothetical protein